MADQISLLLYELCVDLGFCLPPEEEQQLERMPLSDIDAFTDAVIAAEGMKPEYADRRLRRQVREYVERHFSTLQREANLARSREEEQRP